MPYEKVVDLIAAVLALSAYRRAPGTDFRFIRIGDRLEAKNIIPSPFASRKLDPADPASFHEKNRPAFDRGSDGIRLGLKRKLSLRSRDVNTIAASPRRAGLNSTSSFRRAAFWNLERASSKG